jgi:hypothetical protein
MNSVLLCSGTRLWGARALRLTRGRSRARAVAPLIAVVACCAAWFAPLAHAVLPNGFPEKLSIYYGLPEQVNGSAGNTTTAAAVFDDYDLVIFGEGLEQSTHTSHSATQTIIQNIASTTRAYGYLDLCVENPISNLYRCSNFSMTELKSRVDKWQAMGAGGIFLDQAGCDYVVLRARQNEIIDYIHGKSLSAFINVWNQDHAFAPGSIPSPYPNHGDCNPSSLATKLGANDYTLLESWAVILSDWSENVDPALLVPRGNTTLGYKNTYGTKVATVNTIAQGNPPFNQSQLDYVWWSTLLYGFDAMAWGETWVYSSDTGVMPFRTRPNPNGGNIGTATTPLTVAHNGDLHSRATSANTIHLDTAGHTGVFGSKNIVTQPALKPSTLTAGDVVFTAANATFSISSNKAPITHFQIFIDADNNPATGFLHTDEGITNVGADYMIDNANLYSFTGGTQTTWSWSSLASVTPTGVNTKNVSVSIARSQIGHTTATPVNVLAVNADTSWNELDLLPRAPSAQWKAKPGFFTQSGSAATDLVAGDATFSQSQVSSKLTFKMNSNGANINAYRAWIDSDDNPSTGYAFWSVGADYLIENGHLYQFTGASPTTWSWSLKSDVLEGAASAAHGLGTAQITASIIPDIIGYTDGAQVPVLMQHYQASPAADLDLLPRSSGGPWKVSSNLETQGGASESLVFGDAAFSSSKITFTVRSNGGNINSYRVFIDRDNSSATGYRHTAQGITAVGADYMIEDGDLYQFSGATQTSWGWTLVTDQITDSGYGTSQITVEVPKAQINYTANSTIAAVAEHFLSATESLDLLVRSGSTTWRAKP